MKYKLYFLTLYIKSLINLIFQNLRILKLLGKLEGRGEIYAFEPCYPLVQATLPQLLNKTQIYSQQMSLLIFH